jgi:cation diffusion facilitator family transporter
MSHTRQHEPHPSQGHGHGHGQEHGHDAGHGHGHDDGHGPDHDAGHGHGHDHDAGHGHEHTRGLRGMLREFFVPHTHDPADAVDDALEASAQGVRALKISLFILLGTTVLQLLVVLVSGSVALLADTVHNFSDALTAVPLWVAFIIGRRGASRRYTYGLGRAEDIAGLFIIIVVALSAIVAAWQSIDRIFNPQPITNLGWVIVAGLVGFAGNEAVAIYRIRVGRRIGSAALVADGVHARTDGFTSLAVVLGALGVLAGFPLADPIVGLLISAAIVVLLWGTVRSIGTRLLDGIEPELVGRAEHALEHVDGIREIQQVRLRWVGHRLHGDAVIVTDDLPLTQVEQITREAERQVGAHLRNVDSFHVRAATGTRSP